MPSRLPRKVEFLELLPEVDLDMTLLPESSLPIYYLNSELSNSKLFMCPPSSVPSGVAALE